MTNKELETKLNELIARVEKLENRSSKKITLEEFFSSDKDLAIHCDTEERANKLLREFGLMEKVLCDKFDVYGKDTCYSNCGLYGNIEDCKAQDYKIYEFEDIILPDEPNYELIFKTQAEAEHYLHHANVERVEKLPFLTWEEFKGGEEVIFKGRNGKGYALVYNKGLDKIDLFDTDGIMWGIIQSWDLTEANFYKAYDECVKLFKQE